MAWRLLLVDNNYPSDSSVMEKTPTGAELVDACADGVISGRMFPPRSRIGAGMSQCAVEVLGGSYC